MMIRIPVTESSAVAEARRVAGEFARNHGFPETDEGRVKLVVTELASNIIKHGGGTGHILIGHFREPGSTGIEILSLDSGPGIAHLQEALADGYSSAGTAGGGLGAIVRQSDFFDVASWPGNGTAVMVRFEIRKADRARGNTVSRWGAVSIAMPGEEVCGDACSIHEGDDGYTILVADGLGHGPHAAAAANAAVETFQRHKDHQVSTLLDYLHGGLRPTRGAAIAVARVPRGTGRLEFGGIGNIAGVILQANGGTKHLVSLAGTAGHNARKIQSFDYAFGQDLLILHSDGLGTHWALDRYPGLVALHPTLVAAVLARDYWRQRDDVTVVVLRGGAG
jgi:anti-sigma regulatory factor (Ser/Thr protein kinase)